MNCLNQKLPDLFHWTSKCIWRKTHSKIIVKNTTCWEVVSPTLKIRSQAADVSAQRRQSEGCLTQSDTTARRWVRVSLQTRWGRNLFRVPLLLPKQGDWAQVTPERATPEKPVPVPEPPSAPAERPCSDRSLGRGRSQALSTRQAIAVKPHSQSCKTERRVLKRHTLSQILC